MIAIKSTPFEISAEVLMRLEDVSWVDLLTRTLIENVLGMQELFVW